ncbi:uncharacterized protein NPIL_276391 [Nephila pilipes]|uniref:Uncharacterized protein n=1 Tax=Nephila pilipes TaxID=299642 RepID=A0A8X6R254_NEPPI|nr:uncharacterized protein NPIL_276391 [Nephila pilipes]
MASNNKFSNDEIFRFSIGRNLFEALQSDDDLTDEDSSSKEVDNTLTTNGDKVLPSRVTDRKYIFMPSSDEDIDGDEEGSKMGKWMLFPRGDLLTLDEFWLSLLPLYYNGTLIRIKCSTAMGNESGVVNCYTADCENKLDVKKAADAIRDCIDYRYTMYYKTNQASAHGQYRSSGSTHISKYMHSVKKAMFEMDHARRWKIM